MRRSDTTTPPLLFPHPLTARFDGLLVVGGDLKLPRLILAYRFGIFPWYAEGKPIMWFAPRSRFVINVGQIHVPKSMRKYLRQRIFTITLDQHFEYIIDQCQKIKRDGQTGTWITEDLKNAFVDLHERGLAHSIEVWDGNEIVGGLYGLGLGRIFSGESMFSLTSNASKFAVIILNQILFALNYRLIDCQQETPHLKMLGGHILPNVLYHSSIRTNLFQPLSFQKWDQSLVPQLHKFKI